VSPFGKFSKKKKASLLISKEEEFICNFNGYLKKSQTSMLLKKIAAVLLYSLHSQLWENIMLGWLWWSFFLWENKRQKATLVHFFGQNIPFFQKQVANFHPTEIVAPSLHTGYTF